MMMWLSIPITNIMNECIFSWKMVELVVGLGIPLHEERSSRLDCSSSRGYPSAQGWHVGGKSWLRSGRHTILDNTFQRLKAITGFLDNVHDDSAHRGLWSFSFIMATFLPMQLCTQAQMHSQGQKGYRTGLWWDGCVDREVEGIVFDKICSSSTPEIGGTRRRNSFLLVDRLEQCSWGGATSHATIIWFLEGCAVVYSPNRRMLGACS